MVLGEFRGGRDVEPIEDGRADLYRKKPPGTLNLPVGDERVDDLLIWQSRPENFGVSPSGHPEPRVCGLQRGVMPGDARPARLRVREGPRWRGSQP